MEEAAAEGGGSKRCFSGLSDGAVSSVDDMEKRFGQLETQVQEAMMSMKAKEKDLEFQRLVLKRKEEELTEQFQQLQNDRLNMEKQREMERAALSDTKEKLDTKEFILKNMEQDLQGKFLATETLANKLNARESVLENLEKQCEEERLQIRELIGNLEAEKKSVEAAKVELEMSKRNMDEAWSCIKLQIEKDSIDRQKLHIQEAMMSMGAKEKDLEFQRLVLKRKEEELKEQVQQLHNDKLDIEKEREMTTAALKDTKEKLDAKELMLKNMEKDLQGKFIATDTLSSKLSAREIVLENLEKQCKADRAQARELMGNLEAEKKKVEATKVELEMSKRSVEEAWSCISVEHDEAAEYIISVDEKMKTWEDRLKERENEVLKQQEFLKIFEAQLRQEQDQHCILHTNYKKDQEKRAHELRIWEDDLRKRQTTIVREEEIIRKDHEMLNEERKIAEEKLKQAKELKSRTQTLEQQINTQYCVSIQEAKRKEQEYEARFSAVDELKHDLEKKSAELDRKFEELRARKKELKIWRRKAQEMLNKQINLLWKGHLVQGTRNMELFQTKPDTQLNDGEHAETAEDETQLDVGKGILEMQRERGENWEKMQQEASRLAQEKESLKAQQHELEEIRKAVQDAKVTLTTQLNASKKMVVDASLTAQRASREREALEEERKCIVKLQKEMGTALSARETKIALEEEKLERVREAVEKEKTEAINVILKAEQMKKVIGAIDRERDEILCLPENSAGVKPLHQTSSDGQVKNMFRLFNNPLHTDCKHWVSAASESSNTGALRKQQYTMIGREEKPMNELNRSHHYLSCKDDYVASREDYPGRSQSASFPAMIMSDSNWKMICEENIEGELEMPEFPNSTVFTYGASAPAMCTVSESFTRHQDDSPESIEQPKQLSEIMCDNELSFFDGNSPNRKRLETVMTVLLNAKQASRNRLQRTEILLSTLTSESASEIRLTLKALAEELTAMEEVEEDLSSQLKESYNTRSPDSEGVIVDKVQLLCRMEEQQNLRAKWEEQMQHQLEKINMLQTNAFGSSAFNSPSMQTLQEPLSPSSNCHSPKVMYSEDCYGQANRIFPDANIARMNTRTIANHLNEMHLFEDFESYQDQLSNSLSNSVLKLHVFNRNLNNHGNINISPEELIYERNARRRLLLSKSKGSSK